MSESPEPAATPTPPATGTPHRPYWLYRFAAWVGIIAGIVFIISSIFFAGAYISHGGWSGHHCHHHHHAMRHHDHHDHHHHGPGPAASGIGDHETPRPR